MTSATHSDSRIGSAEHPEPTLQPARGTIYVIAPVHNRRPLTERFVQSLLAQRDGGFHLILVDDGSTDGTSDAVRALLPSATILTGPGSWWWAGSLQQARRWLSKQPEHPDDLVLLANDDTTFGPEFLAAARAAMAAAPRSLLLAQPTSAQSGESPGIGVEVDWRKLSFRPTFNPDDIGCFPTRGLFLTRHAFQELGGFHTLLLPHYLSDYEYTIRAARRGYALRTDPAVRLIMDEVTTGIRAHDYRSVPAYLRSVFTIRATKNPIYWSSFVVLASPRRLLLRNLVRVWKRFFKGLVKAARARSTPAG
jgi:GT2 family glycosyltransferase